MVNNAPAPDAMREEFINIVTSTSHVQRAVAEQLVDAILAKQMLYYMEMAEPEVDDDMQAKVAALSTLKMYSDSVISIGASFTQFMTDEQRRRWQSAAIGLRTNVDAVLQLLV